MTDGVISSCHKIKYKQTKESWKLVEVHLQCIQLRGLWEYFPEDEWVAEVKIWETSGSYEGHGNLRTACPRFPRHHSYSIKSTAEDVRVADDEGVWCFAVTQLRALRVTCGWPWDARMCGSRKGSPLTVT